MSSEPRSRRAAPTTPFVPSPWLVLAALVVATLIVQRHALHEYFALDDLILFQQAAGIRAWPVTAWRWLSGWAWFRAVVPMWGHEPFPYHAASLAVHVVNVVLLQRVLRRLGASEIAAFVGTAAFALSRLHFPALLAATSIGELLALTFVLVAVLVMGRPRVGALALPAMLLAVSAKESVFLVPFAMLLLVESSESFAARARRLAPALATGAIAGALLLASGIGSGRLGGEAYSVSFGANLAENIARLFGWTIDLFDPIPDLHAATAGAAHLVLPLVALTALAWWRGGALVRVGAAWWWLAVLPVLPLPGRTYLHYLYVALAGAAMIVAALWDAVLARRPQASGRARWAVAVLVVVVGAAWSDVLLSMRLDLRMPNVDWAMDPVLRKSRIAEGAIRDVRTTLGTLRGKVAILIPASISGSVDLGTGRITAGGTFKRYELAADLDDGATLRAMVPTVDSAAIVTDFAPGHDGWRYFISRSDSRLVDLGTLPGAHVRVVEALIASGLPSAALDYAQKALANDPTNEAMRARRDRAAAALANAPALTGGTP